MAVLTHSPFIVIYSDSIEMAIEVVRDPGGCIRLLQCYMDGDFACTYG